MFILYVYYEEQFRNKIKSIEADVWYQEKSLLSNELITFERLFFIFKLEIVKHWKQIKINASLRIYGVR